MSTGTTMVESVVCGSMALFENVVAAKCATYMIVDPDHVENSCPIFGVVVVGAVVTCVGVVATIDINTVSVGTIKFGSVKPGG